MREALDEVALPADDTFLRRYPHQLSGGQQQRVAIAMAFLCRPTVIVLDEPTTGLDVTTQAHVLETVRDLCRSHRVAALYVSHDLAVVAELADRMAVMYAGRIVEIGPREEVFTAPRDPYTRRLLRAVPESRASAPWSASPASPRCPDRARTAASSPRAASFATRGLPHELPARHRLGAGHAGAPRPRGRVARPRRAEGAGRPRGGRPATTSCSASAT